MTPETTESESTPTTPIAEQVGQHCLVRPWKVVEGHAATRTLNGQRVAFIEKTPRVKHPESGEWIAGPKGAGGNGPDVNGGYQPSRDWCDEKMVELGYSLANV